MADPIKQPNRIPGYSAPAMNNAGATNPFARPTAPNIYDFTQRYNNQNNAGSSALPNTGVPGSGSTSMAREIKPPTTLAQSKPWLVNPGDWRIEANENGIIHRRNIRTGQRMQEQDPKAVQGMINSWKVEREANAYQQRQKQQAEEAERKRTDGSYWGILRNNIQAFRARAGASAISTGLALGNNIYGIAGLIGDGLGIDSMRDWGYKHFKENQRTIQEFNDEVKANNPWSMYTPEWAKEVGEFGAKYTPDVLMFAASLGTSALSQAGAKATTQAATQATTRAATQAATRQVTTQAATRATTQAAAKETAKNVSKYIPKKMVKYVDDAVAKVKPPGPVAQQVKPIAKAVFNNPVSGANTTSDTVGMIVDMRTEQPVQEQPQPEQPQMQAQNQFDINGFMDAMAPMMQAGYNSQQYGNNQQYNQPQFNGNTTSYYRS